MSWCTIQHCETEYGEYEAQAIQCSAVFLLTMLVILANAERIMTYLHF